jgi:hypothetical protein
MADDPRMEINRNDAAPQLRAAAIQVRAHADAALRSAAQVPHAGTATERVLAAARAVDELVHAIELAAVAPGLSFVPPVAGAVKAYETARAVLRGATGTGLGGDAHPVLGASELLAARDHLVEAVALHAQPGATEVERQRATELLDASLGDVNSGFAFLGHPMQEGPMRATIALAKQAIEFRQPIDAASINAAAQVLAEAARASLAGVPVEQAVAMPGVAEPAAPAAPVAPEAPAAPATPVPQAHVPGTVRLDLPRFELPPVPSFGPPR